MPKRVQFEKNGDSSVLQYVDYTPGALSKGDVRVKNAAIGVNLIEAYYREGVYKTSSFPSGLGGTGAGIVKELGPGVTDFAVGDRVAYATGPIGSYSEIYDVPADLLVRVPEGIKLEDAASSLQRGLTVQYLFRQLYELKKGQTILFYAAAGGVGLIALQWAKLLEVNVIAVAGSDEKLELARQYGASATINSRTEDIAKRVLEITDGKKVPVVYDSVGKETWEASLDSASPRGLIVSYGNASGTVDIPNLGVLAAKGSLFVTRPSLYNYASDAKSLRAMADEFFGLVLAGKIKIHTNHTYKLSEAAKAQDDLTGRKTTGSLVLIP